MNTLLGGTGYRLNNIGVGAKSTYFSLISCARGYEDTMLSNCLKLFNIVLGSSSVRCYSLRDEISNFGVLDLFNGRANYKDNYFSDCSHAVPETENMKNLPISTYVIT